MKHENLKARTKKFAVEIVKLVDGLPSGGGTNAMGNQLLRSGTSVGANYRAACRAKSSSDFIYKMTIVEEEADESLFWLEVLMETGKVNMAKAPPLAREAEELLAISIASINTARKRSDAPLARPTRAAEKAAVAKQTPHSALRTPHSQ